MNSNLKQWIRLHCPNIKWLRRKLGDIKLKEYSRHIMAQEDVQSGEQSAEKLHRVVRKYTELWPKKTASLTKSFNEYAGRCKEVGSRSDKDALLEKVLFNCFGYGFEPDEFFVYELENKTAEEKKKYISNTERYRMVYKMNDIIDMEIFFDKFRTYEKYKKYFRREAVSVHTENDRSAFKAFVKRHPVFVQKNVALSRGDSVKLVDIAKVGKTVDKYFDSLLGTGKYIIEERVVQSETMNRLNPSSVNTVRCMTFIGSDGKIKIGPCFLKVGQGNSFVDNGGAGGILIGIDEKNGIIVTDGFDEFIVRYKKHPDTGTVFQGYRLPDWEQLKKLAVEIAAQTPSIKYIGWDFAHTDNGWVIIEGNCGGQMIGPQIVFERGYKKDIAKLTHQNIFAI